MAICRDSKGRFCRRPDTDDTPELPFQEPSQDQIVKGYKGFHDDLTCRGMQYKIGEWQHMDGKVSLCFRGLHFCDHPLAPMIFYGPAISVYTEVDAYNPDCIPEESNSLSDVYKSVTTALKPTQLLSVDKMISAAIDMCLPEYHKSEHTISIASCPFSVAAPCYNRKLKAFVNAVGRPTIAITQDRCSVAMGCISIVMGNASISRCCGAPGGVAVAWSENSIAVSDYTGGLAFARGDHSVAEVREPHSVCVIHEESGLARVFADGCVVVTRGSVEIAPTCGHCIVVWLRDYDQPYTYDRWDSSKYLIAPKGTVIMFRGRLGPVYDHAYVVDDKLIPANQKISYADLDNIRNFPIKKEKNE